MKTTNTTLRSSLLRSTRMSTILVLALGLMVWSASVAEGAQSLTVNGQNVTSITLELGQSRTVEVVSTDSVSYVDYVGFDNGVVLGTFSDLETRTEAGSVASVVEYNEPAFYGYLCVAAGGPSSGVHFVFQYDALQLGTTYLKLYDSTLTSLIDSVQITVIPLQPVAIGTAFTYQGRLIDANDVADGLYDFQFKLYDNADPVFAAQQGSTIDINDLDVIDGYFTVELDFGAVFDGKARWLEIGVRPGASIGAYDTLSPRQETTPTPYAIYAQTAEDANTVDGLHASQFAGSLHVHPGEDITSGTVHTSRYSAYGDLSVEGYLGNAAGDLARNNGVLQPTLNADMLDSYHEGSFFQLNQNETVSGRPAFIGGVSGATAPFSVDSSYLVSLLNADYLDGLHASNFVIPANDYGRSGVSANLYEGGTPLVNKYLGKTAKAADSDKVDGLHASSFLTTASDAGRSGVVSTLYESTTALSSKYLGIGSTATNSDRVDGYHESSFFRLSQGEMVTGRPYFYGGTSGSTSPFYVDSSYKVSSLNADMVDGSHASAFSTTSHNHDSTYVNDGGGEINSGNDFSFPLSLYWNSTSANTMFQVRRNYSGTYSSGSAIGALSGGGKNAISARVQDGGGDAIYAINWGSGHAIEAWSGHGDDYVARFMSNSGSGGKGVYIQGYLTVTGTKSSVVETSEGQKPLFAIESPKVEFCSSGSASLTGGEAKVQFVQLFAEAISPLEPVKVLVTPTNECNGMYVTAKSSDGFTVRELQGGTSNAGFDWMAIGTRKGYESTPYIAVESIRTVSKPE